ncbi:MAG: hypothetical protein ACU841_17120 [Gammaproteobacteria bacterium]
MVDKPTVLLNASPRAVHAQSALKEVLAVMSALHAEEASIIASVLGFYQDEAGILADAALTDALQLALKV